MSDSTSPPVTGAPAQIEAPAGLAEAPKPIVPQASSVKEEPAAAPKSSLLQKVAAAAKDKGALVAERDAATERADAAEAELEKVRGELATAQARVSELEDEQQAIEAALTTAQGEAAAAKAEVKKVADEVTTTVAGIGFNAEALPPNQESQGATLEQAIDRMNACTDPIEKAELAREVKRLRAEAN